MSAAESQSAIDAIQRVAHREPDGVQWFDFFGDQRDVRTIGEAVAAAVSDLPVDAVVTWFHPDETVLGHVVASALGVGRGAIEEDLGLLTLMPEGLRPSRVIVVATHFTKLHNSDALQMLIEGKGHELLASVSLNAENGVVVERFTAST